MSANMAKVFLITLNSQNNLEKEEKIGRLTLLDFKTYYKAVITETLW